MLYKNMFYHFTCLTFLTALSCTSAISMEDPNYTSGHQQPSTSLLQQDIRRQDAEDSWKSKCQKEGIKYTINFLSNEEAWKATYEKHKEIGGTLDKLKAALESIDPSNLSEEDNNFLNKLKADIKEIDYKGMEELYMMIGQMDLLDEYELVKKTRNETSDKISFNSLNPSIKMDSGEIEEFMSEIFKIAQLNEYDPSIQDKNPEENVTASLDEHDPLFEVKKALQALRVKKNDIYQIY